MLEVFNGCLLVGLSAMQMLIGTLYVERDDRGFGYAWYTIAVLSLIAGLTTIF